MAQALGVDSQAVGGNGHGTQGQATMRTTTTCAREMAARSPARGPPTHSRFRRQERVIFRGERASGCRGAFPQQQDGQSQQAAHHSGQGGARAAPGTPSPAPQTVMPHSVRVGLMRKKLKMASSTQTNTLMRLAVRALPAARRMEAYMPMAMVKGSAVDQMAK